MAVIFYPPRNTGGGGGAATWGSITGTLSAQTDLQTELNAKANTSVLANYLLKSSNLSDVANVATARNNLGLGSIALQNSNSVTITGGNITGLTSLTVTNPSASQISVGNSADITLRTSGTGTLQLVNQVGTVYSRMVSGSRFDWLSNSASTPYSYELNNASDLIYFSKYIRNRTTGNSTWFDDKVVNTTGVLTTTDSCLDAWHIVPTSGVAIENLIAHRVTTASTTVPTSAMEFRTMSNGGGVALFRVGGGINGVYFGSDVTSSATRIGLIYNNNTGYNLTFPPTAGTNGQMLQTDGTGTLSWVTPSGGGGKETIARAKEASESVSSSTTLQNDDDFVFPLKANKKYVISGDLRLSANASGGFKAAWTLPSGTTGRFSIIEDTANPINNADAATGGGQTATLLVGNVCVIYGYILTSSTAGDAIFQWAQNAPSAASTTINQCSTMILTEV